MDVFACVPVSSPRLYRLIQNPTPRIEKKSRRCCQRKYACHGGRVCGYFRGEHPEISFQDDAEEVGFLHGLKNSILNSVDQIQNFFSLELKAGHENDEIDIIDHDFDTETGW